MHFSMAHTINFIYMLLSIYHNMSGHNGFYSILKSQCKPNKSKYMLKYSVQDVAVNCE